MSRKAHATIDMASRQLKAPKVELLLPPLLHFGYWN